MFWWLVPYVMGECFYVLMGGTSLMSGGNLNVLVGEISGYVDGNMLR